jgi:predicted RNA polymerase sigma factor
MLRALLPGDAEVTGLLALLLLTDARRPARTSPGGLPVPMAEQDRGKWDTARIAEGTALVTEALRRGPPGPYQVQAAIAALHDEAPTAQETDWPQILALYEVLMQASDNPVVALNHAVAAAMVHGPRVGLDLLENVGADQRMAAGHRLHAIRANLLEMAGDRDAARHAYLRAAELTASPPHQRYLNARAARLADQAS